MRKISTRTAVSPTISDSSIVVQGDVFSEFAPCIQFRDLEQYVERQPNVSDPFTCALKRGKDPHTYEVWQPEITYITESFPNDPWALFLAGKGPRPIKLSAADEAVARQRDEAANYDDDGVDQSPFSSGVGFTAEGSDAFSSGAPAWTHGPTSFSGRFRTRRGSRRWSRPGTVLPVGPIPEPVVAARGMAGQARNLPEPRWTNSNLPLRVYISSTVAAARDGLISHEIKSALREWREASNGRLYYVLTDQYTEADIVFVCEMTSDHQWAENVTDYHNANYDRVRVRLMTDTLFKLEPKRLRGLCLHEVGHAFGIRNHSSDKRDAMSLGATDDFHPVLLLSNNDRRLIAKLYP